MRKRASTHRLVEDRHQEHVTVFKIWLHFIDGLQPERKTTVFVNRKSPQLVCDDYLKVWHHCEWRALTSRHQTQPAIALRRWGPGSEPWLWPPWRSWPVQTAVCQITVWSVVRPTSKWGQLTLLILIIFQKNLHPNI